MNTDVLIIGAGPTGLMLANQLGRRGVRTRIIDRHSGPAQQSRALGVQARTLEIYAKLGVIDRALELGKRATGANIWANGKHTGRVPLGEAGAEATAFPYVWILGQDDNERILGDKLRDWKIDIEWNTELIGLQSEPDRVNATVKASDGTKRTIIARYIAGCDGARSAVRELNGITFPGAPYEHVFFVADTDVTGNMIADEVNVYLWKDGFHLFFPMRGENHWRIVGILPEALQGRKEIGFDDVLPSIREEAGANLHFTACSWFSTYRIHHRSASHFRSGRSFVLGDAAHIHSPVGAQGMNTGLQDAYNLAWKLALVVQDKAADSLLNTYEEERLPVAKRLLNTTDRAFRIVVSDSWIAGLLRTKILARIAAFGMQRKSIQRAAFRVVSQIAIHYRLSSLSQSLQPLPDKAPQSGDRFPWLHLHMQVQGKVVDLFEVLDDTRFNLLLFVAENARSQIQELPELVETRVVPDDEHNRAELQRVHIPIPSFYLLRPDGHVGLCGESIDAAGIERYFKTCLKHIGQS